MNVESQNGSADVEAVQIYLATAEWRQEPSANSEVSSMPRLWSLPGWALRCWRSIASLAASRVSSRPRLLSVVEKVDLGPKKSLWVVAYEQRHFLVTCGAETAGAALEVSRPGSAPRERIPIFVPERWMEN
jgi:hypothetical protein